MSATLSPVTTSTGRVLPFDPTTLSMGKLLKEALENPGLLATCYQKFHSYSLNNRLLVAVQCHLRNLQPGPFAAYAAWQKLDRQVRKGERALFILHPMFRKETDETTGKETQRLVGFTYKASAFVLSQTDGDDLDLAEKVPFDLQATLTEARINCVPFEMTDGNCQGYAKPGRQISVSPIAAHPERTLFHEIGHVLLGHVDEKPAVDDETRNYSTGEVEAEAFSYLVCGMLGIADDELSRSESRGYIRYWMENAPASDWSGKNVRRVFGAVDRFLGLTKKGDSTADA